MGNETFKKRQKEAARREKREKKIALRIERKRERAGGAKQPQGGEHPPDCSRDRFRTGTAESAKKPVGQRTQFAWPNNRC